MATISENGQRREPRSGGKIVRPRRGILPKTPYDRPRLINSTQPNPNWISRHIFSPTRTIVTGASRILSSVLGFDASSSSCSSSDSGSTSDDTDDNNSEQDVSSQGVHTIENREPQSFAGKNETKHLIEQLLMQETFSREECDKLTNIIKSRVVDSPMIRGMGLGRLNEMPNRTVGSEIHDLGSVAVMEARKFLEEKKPGSNSKSELYHGTSALNSVTLAHGVEGAAGSPVDMAKSYMRTRPPWASPSTGNIESPSPIGMPLFKEETPYSIGGNSLYSSKWKRDSPATGTWNIQEEIRKVRSKATEEMLRTLSSSKMDWSSFALEHKNDSLVANNLGPAEEDNPQGSKNSVDASADLAAEPDETLDQGQRFRSTIDMNTAPQSDVAAADVDHLKNSNGSIQPLSSTREGTLQDSQVEDRNCLTSKEVGGIGVAASTANGFPSLGSSISAELLQEQNHRPINEEDKAFGSGHDNAFRVAAEEKCELLSEASVEVPIVNATDAVASDSYPSSSMHYEGSPQHQRNTPNSKRSLAGKSNSGINKQQGKQVSRYNTRSRGGDS